MFFRKNIISLLLISFLIIPFTMTYAEHKALMSDTGHMYMNFGMGVGNAVGWSKSSLALDAMTMGLYLKKDRGVELGMGMITNGIYDDHDARINNFHFAGKARLPFTDLFSVYGKLGVGISLGQGHVAPTLSFMTTNVGPYYGAGALLRLTNHFSLYLEDSGIVVVQKNQRFGSVNQVMLGVEFHR